LLTICGACVAIVGLVRCKENNEGTLVVRWKVKSPRAMDPDPCTTAGISNIQVVVSRTGQTDDPPVATEEFACSAREARFDLREGLYDVELFKREGSTLTPVVTKNAIEVLAGSTWDWAGSFPPFPEEANDINIPWCGNGELEEDQGEQCDDGQDNSDATANACRTDCTDPFCGDGVADAEEECDASDLAGTTCETLGLIGGVPLCTADCLLDVTPCMEPRTSMTLMWDVQTFDASPSNCAAEGIVQVHYQIKPANLPEVVSEGYASCADGMVVTAILDFGVYDIYLRGLGDQLQLEASGQLTNHDHTDFVDTTAHLILRALP
jgi:hypothetical protein